MYSLKNFLEPSENETDYMKKMIKNLKEIKEKTFLNEFSSSIGKAWESLIYNYFSYILQPYSAKNNYQIFYKDIMNRLNNPEKDYYELKASSQFLIDLKKFKTIDKEDNKSGSDNKIVRSSESDSKRKKNAIGLNSSNHIFSDFFKNIDNNHGVEIEIDGFYHADGSSYLNLRENFYDYLNNPNHALVKRDDKYSIILEIGINFTNTWYKKFSQLGKLVCFLQYLQKKKDIMDNIIIQMIFNSDLKDYLKSLNALSNLIQKYIEDLKLNGILLFIDYINLPVYYSMQMSYDKILHDDIEKIKSENKKYLEDNTNIRNEIKEITQKNKEMEEKNKEMDEKNKEMEEKNKEMEKKNKEMQEKNEEITQKNREIEEKYKGIEEKNKEIEEKNIEMRKEIDQLKNQMKLVLNIK